MPLETFEANSVLGIEIGSVNTRAILFDVVEESYHFIASGSSPSTHLEPTFDIVEGIYAALANLQTITGRVLLDNDGNLLIPSQAGGEGVDRFVVTTSCGPDIRIVSFGLLGDVSLDSVNKLAYSTYGKVVESIGINDRRPLDVQLDAVLAARPDLILFAGGADGGANRSVMRLSNLITSVMQILPKSQRPRMLYCGNRDLGKKITETFDRFTQVKVTQNVRPSLDEEVLGPALSDLDEMVLDMQYSKVNGLKRMAPLCSTPPVLSNHAFSHVINFLGRQYDPAKGVLGIDIGGSHSVAAFANHRTSVMNTFGYGLGSGISAVAEAPGFQELMKWLDGSLTKEQVLDYIRQKSMYPNAIPTSSTDLSIELAVARHIMRLIMRTLISRHAFPSNRFEPILLSGSVVNRTATPMQSLLAILDGIQPLGISPLILDKHAILPILGVAGMLDPLLPVQILESSAFTNLATVVSTASNSRLGNTILETRLEYSDGTYSEVAVKQGSIVSFPLASGEIGRLQLKPVRQTMIEEVDFPLDSVTVNGGVCGLVIDARGRPLQLPEDAGKRTELFHDWEFMLGTK
jgi:hypothetical protein